MRPPCTIMLSLAVTLSGVVPAPAQPAEAPTADAATRQAQARELRVRARQLHEQSLDDLAIDTLRQALTIYPSYPLAHNELGVLLVDEGLLVGAEHEFEEAIRLDPEFAEPWANLAETRRRTKQLDKATDAYRRYLELAPADPEAYYALAAVYQEQGKLSEALWAMEKVLEHNRNPTTRQVREASAAAAALIRQGVESRAPTAVAEAPPTATPGAEPGEEAPEYADTDAMPGALGSHAGDAAFFARRYVAAQKAYRAAVEAKPDDVELLYKLGATHAVMGDYRGALRWWRRALALDPGRALIVHHIGLASLALAKQDQLSLAPGGEQDALARAREALADGRPAHAIAHLEGAVGAEAGYLRGEAALRTGQLELAKGSFEAVLANDKEHRAALGGLAEALIRLGAGDAADEALRAWLGERSALPEEFVVIRAAEADSRIEFGPATGGEEDDF